MELAVVLGASGRLGRAVVDELVHKGVRTRILVRNLDRFLKLYPENKLPGEIEAIEGDLDNNRSLALAMEDADTVFLCFNTVYSRWDTEMVRWVARVADLAAVLQARIMFPGNILNFGSVPEEHNPINEEYPQNPETLKGKLRVAIENRLVRAAMEGATLTILRFPHLFGPAMSSGLINDIFVCAAQEKQASWIGNPKTPFQFLYTRDAASVMVQASQNPKAADTMFHVPSEKILTPDEFIQMIYSNVAHPPDPAYKIISKRRLQFKSLVSKETDEFLELYYLYEQPIILDGKKYKEVLGEIKYTKYEDAIAETLQWYQNYL